MTHVVNSELSARPYCCHLRECTLGRIVGSTMTRLEIRVRELRNALGWSQAYLAERAGIRRATVVAIEQGTKSIDLDVLDRLATAFGYAPGALIQYERPTPVRQDSDDELA